MSVIHLLHEESFTEDRINILLLLPKANNDSFDRALRVEVLRVKRCSFAPLGSQLPDER